MKGEIIEREIFSSEITIDGRNAKMSQEERDTETKEIYKNTKTLLNAGLILPVKDGHEDRSEKAKGFIIDISLKRRKRETPKGEEIKYYAIVGKLFLFEDFYNLYKEGRYPTCSIEAYDNYFLNNGKVGLAISAVAMLGTSLPALPMLVAMMMHKNKKRYYTAIDQIPSIRKKYKLRSYSTMDKKTVLSAVEPVINSFVENLESAINLAFSEEVPTEEPEEATEEPTEEMETTEETDEKEEMECKDKKGDKASKEEYSIKNKELFLREIDLAFKELKIDGIVKEHQKEYFQSVARTNSIEFAKELFSNINTKPIAGEKITKEPLIEEKHKAGIVVTQKDKDAYMKKYHLNRTKSGNLQPMHRK